MIYLHCYGHKKLDATALAKTEYNFDETLCIAWLQTNTAQNNEETKVLIRKMTKTK